MEWLQSTLEPNGKLGLRSALNTLDMFCKEHPFRKTYCRYAKSNTRVLVRLIIRLLNRWPSKVARYRRIALRL